MTGGSRRPAHRERALGTGVTAVFAAMLLAGCAAQPPAAPPTASHPAVERPAAPEGALPDALQGELRQAVEQTMTEYGVPGAAVGVWMPGEGSWTSAVGTADMEDEVAVDTAMQWPLRSITKSYTVTLVLQLVDEGVISLEETISEYVDGVTDGDEITLRDLAGMTSGNADYTNEEFAQAFLVEDAEQIFTLDELNGFMLHKPALFAPGSAKAYNNANINLLGAVVEQATGQPFDQVLRERILEPVGQEETAYLIDASRWDAPHPVGYAPGESGLEPQPTNMSVFGPAGSMVSTLEDGRVWAELLATGALLDAETQQERRDGAPLDSGPPYDRYALGMGETDGWWGHNGEGFGFTAALFHEPDSAASIVVYTNLSNEPSGAHPADQMFRRLAAVIEEGSER